MYSRRAFAATYLLLVVCTALLATGCGNSETTQGVPASINAPDGSDPAAPPDSGTNVPGRSGSPDRARTDRLPAPSAEPRPAQVLIKTSLGDMTVELDARKARLTVDNFLENYVDRRHYDQTIFHHVDQGFMVLGGGFTRDMKAKPWRAGLLNEATNGLKNRRGTIAMARTRSIAHSATCQFFFNLVDNPNLDHKSRDNAEEFGYCVFGKIVQGLDVLDRIAQVKVHESDGFAKLPIEPVVIESIRRID